MRHFTFLLGILALIVGLDVSTSDAGSGLGLTRASRLQRQADRAFNRGFNEQLGRQTAAVANVQVLAFGGKARVANVKVANVAAVANVKVARVKAIPVIATSIKATPVVVGNVQTVRFNSFGTRTVVDSVGNVLEVDPRGIAVVRGNLGGFNQLGGVVTSFSPVTTVIRPSNTTAVEVRAFTVR